MTPLFKSHYSIGKSILTLNEPSKEDGSSDSVFDIVSENNLKEVVMVEDSFMGFLQCNKVCKSLGVNFRFGLRLSIIDEGADIEDKKTTNHKVVIFSKNSSGCKILFKIYSKAKSNQLEAITLTDLLGLWDSDNLDLAIPFYDSFLFKNLFSFSCFALDLSPFNPTFFTESNGLPFDFLLDSTVRNYTESNGFQSMETKSIYYKNRRDFDSFLTYKLICSRNSFASRKSSLEKPNLDHMGSKEFCFESLLDNQIQHK